MENSKAYCEDRETRESVYGEVYAVPSANGLTMKLRYVFDVPNPLEDYLLKTSPALEEECDFSGDKPLEQVLVDILVNRTRRFGSIINQECHS